MCRDRFSLELAGPAGPHPPDPLLQGETGEFAWAAQVAERAPSPLERVGTPKAGRGEAPQAGPTDTS